MLISVIIGTRDRAESLRETLASLSRVRIPDGSQGEIVVVDNGSRDHTGRVISEACHPNAEIRYISELIPGQAHARNRGLAEARGDVILLTDDDLRFPENWIEAMTEPLLQNTAQGVAGGIRLAPHLVRPWMEQTHRYWLAENALEPGPANHMIGANMGVRREVLDKVPGFDPELGPGALGFGEDSLFSYQLCRSGYSLIAIEQTVEHHLLPSRLTRSNFLNHARALGRSGAYHDYHWEHTELVAPHIHLIKKAVQLMVWRRMHPKQVSMPEGMHPHEMHHLRSFHLYGQYLIERRRSRNYDKHGLKKLYGMGSNTEC